jgi:hypothetical protein
MASLSSCGPSPAANGPGRTSSGTLVVVVREGPDLVPFHPMLARVGEANAQLAAKLGHSIRIEVDGALLPQSREAAEDVLAHLVEDVARDMDALSKTDPKALAFATEAFERLVVRYSPTEAAAREDRWQPSSGAKLLAATKTVDVVRKEATWRPLADEEVASVLYRAFEESTAGRYASVLPDALPAAQRREWFDYHKSRGGKTSSDPYAQVGPVGALRVRGMVMLYGLASRDGDVALTKDARTWLVRAASDFASAYHHELPKIESAPASSSYAQAEAAYMAWLRAELPRMTLDERGEIASHLWVTDFRKDMSARDRFAARAFPGIDRMAFGLSAIDAWIGEGHPPRPPSHDVHPLYGHTVCPVIVGTKKNELHFEHAGRCEITFYRWVVADSAREDALVRGMLARPDTAFATSAFYNVHTALREEPDYLRFLRRFEAAPTLWKIGADVLREVVFRPDVALLEEARRLWRTVPAARGHALVWLASHADGSYTPDKEWPGLLSGTLADDATMEAFLELGSQAFKLLPAAWPALAKGGRRVRVITKGAKPLLEDGTRVEGTLVAVARLMCDERNFAELAELRAWAQVELAARPGAGLSDVVSAADPASCKPRAGRERP